MGGNTAKIYAETDLNGVPIRILLSPRNVHDIKLADKLIENLNVKTVLGDRGCDSDEFRKIIENPCIPGRKNRKIEIQYDKELYKKRNVVERFFLKLKPFRKVSTRYEQKPQNFLSLVLLATSLIVMRCFSVHVVYWKTFQTLVFKAFSVGIYLEGLGFRSIGRILKVSNVSVLNWIKSFGDKVKELRKNDEISVVEMDEMHIFIGSKKMSYGYGLLLIGLEKIHQFHCWRQIEANRTKTL